MPVAYRMGRAIKAAGYGLSATTAYLAVAASAVTRNPASPRTHKMMLDHYQQTKNLLVSYSENKLGFF